MAAAGEDASVEAQLQDATPGTEMCDLLPIGAVVDAKPDVLCRQYEYDAGAGFVSPPWHGV